MKICILLMSPAICMHALISRIEILLNAATISVGGGQDMMGTNSSSIGGIVGGVVTAIILILTLILVLVVLTVLVQRHKMIKGKGVCLF